MFTLLFVPGLGLEVMSWCDSVMLISLGFQRDVSGLEWGDLGTTFIQTKCP